MHLVSIGGLRDGGGYRYFRMRMSLVLCCCRAAAAAAVIESRRRRGGGGGGSSIDIFDSTR